MRIFLNELSDVPTELDFTDEQPWVQSLFKGFDEGYDGKPAHPKALDRNSRIHVSLQKVDEVIVTRGVVKSRVELCCSRCATPFTFPLDIHFDALYCRDPVMAGVAFLGQDQHGEMKRQGANAGYARHAPRTKSDTLEGVDGDMDITYLKDEFLELEDVFREQIQLAIPVQPLHKDDCKGICANCGADLNSGRCACSRIKKDSPFAGLASIKEKLKH